jgi:hypothetical protein
MIRQKELYCKLTNDQCTWGWFIEPDIVKIDESNIVNINANTLKTKPRQIKSVKTCASFEMELKIEKSSYKLSNYIDTEVIIRSLYVFTILILYHLLITI